MIIKVTPDKEKAKSILNMVESREEFIVQTKEHSYPNMLAENYYEIIKELATAIALTDGVKTIGENAHKELSDLMSEYGLKQNEIEIVNDLRIKRNKSLYEGKLVDQSYITNKEGKLLELISKLKSILKDKI